MKMDNGDMEPWLDDCEDNEIMQVQWEYFAKGTLVEFL